MATPVPNNQLHGKEYRLLEAANDPPKGALKANDLKPHLTGGSGRLPLAFGHTPADFP
jgi:hypothetical protein